MRTSFAKVSSPTTLSPELPKDWKRKT